MGYEWDSLDDYFIKRPWGKLVGESRVNIIDIYEKKSLINEIFDLKKIAFVPTMGALHKGHISLIRKAKNKKNKILVSIYVNPKQFNSKKDFKKYPRK